MTRASHTEEIRAEWNAVASDWNDATVWQRIEAAAQTVNERLADRAGIGPGDRVLDVGTGIGEPAVTAARRVGPSGRVLGIDLAERMIAEGRKRVARLGLPQVELRVADAARLDLPEGSFDAVLSRWTLMLMEDLQDTLAGLCRLLRPDGRLAVALWGHPHRVPLISIAFEAAMPFLGEALPEPPPEDAPRHLWLAGAPALADVARRAGFRSVRTEVVAVVFEFDSPEQYARFIVRVAGPVRLVAERLAGRDPAAAGRVTDAITVRAARHRGPDGRLRMVNENLVLVGARPAA